MRPPTICRKLRSRLLIVELSRGVRHEQGGYSETKKLVKRVVSRRADREIESPVVARQRVVAHKVEPSVRPVSTSCNLRNSHAYTDTKLPQRSDGSAEVLGCVIDVAGTQGDEGKWTVGWQAQCLSRGPPVDHFIWFHEGDRGKRVAIRVDCGASVIRRSEVARLHDLVEPCALRELLCIDTGAAHAAS